MGYTYRCRRHVDGKSHQVQKTFPRPLEHYKHTPKCPECGSRLFWWLHVRRQNRDDYCTCSGYHWKHRKGSKFCEHNAWAEYHTRVEREREDPQEVLLDMFEGGRTLCGKPEPGDECPF